MSILKEIKTTLVITMILLVACCGAYPYAVYQIGKTLFPRQAEGSLIFDSNGKTIASVLIGQSFSGPSYFNPRPSAAGQGYDATSSGGSNLGPTSQALQEKVKQRIAEYRLANHLPEGLPIPADAVTASASGLDPHISLKNARLQLPRVAQARGLSESALAKLVEKYTDGRDFGILGEPGVNIVKLNLALDGKYK